MTRIATRIASHMKRVAVILLGFTAATTRSQETPPALQFEEALVLPALGKFQRTPVYTDEVEYLRAHGQLESPKEGAAIASANGVEGTWKRIRAAEDGFFRDDALGGGYAFLSWDSPGDRVLLLSATGQSAAFVNGEPRAGDPYNYGKLALPVRIRAGRNEILLPCGRGQVKVSLTPAPKPLFLDTKDLTLPNLLVGEETKTCGAITVVNATRLPASLLRIGASVGGGKERISREVSLVELSARKCAFPLETDERWAAEADAPLRVRLYAGDPGGRRVLDETTVSLKVVRANAPHARTFLSSIDDSVQYFAVMPRANRIEKSAPAKDSAEPSAATAYPPATSVDPPAPALFISLHGAGVEASGQAACYAPKDWGVVVAPTNRRSFGFDWEDWGRLDALEVLDIASRAFGVDPSRVYLTGHSMGGHGTWQIGATLPERFAAIGPSAGWETFWSYTGAARLAADDPVEAMLARATNPSDTVALMRNYAQLGVYVLHGDADDNVPVARARAMRSRLAEFHGDFAYYERPSAGHWWGNACVDWPAMFEFFQRHARPALEDVRHVEFITANPGVSSRCDWLTLEAQVHPLMFSSADIRLEAERNAFTGTTENVERLSVDLVALRKAWASRTPAKDDPSSSPASPPSSLSVTLDGQTIADITVPVDEGALHFTRVADHWTLDLNGPAPPWMKSPRRYGPFKDAFRNRMIFVYGTQGSAEENAWALAKARFDAETFWYRGNGSPDVVADMNFDSTKEPDRSVILYGHSAMNAAWSRLLPQDCPVVAKPGSVRIGESDFRGDDLACLFVRPRPGSETACVAVIAGTGLPGMRVTDRFPVFMSGVAYPDCIVISSEMLRTGAKAVRAAGFFGNDWSVERGEFAFRSE
ncbi:MAG: prolyl oligopeptidase family serine peptidase [Phycisphaerales bacterium]|nr:prolyl oligopeptidase family serine peptidase [Phycisphaerales bacterium]